MRTIWQLINCLKISKKVKNFMYIFMLILINAILGGIVWGIFGRFYCPGVAWLICFMGYPAVIIGLFCGVIYLYNHEFA